MGKGGGPAKRKCVAAAKAPGPPGAPGAPEAAEAPGAPEDAGSTSKGRERAAWRDGLKLSDGAAEAEETRRHPREKPSSEQSTLSVALPASIIANAQSSEMKAALVGQVARTLTIMGVDEVVVYEDEATVAHAEEALLAAALRAHAGSEGSAAEAFR
ncbi:hypothetical protein ACSSS7_004337 [Eimeria intestinalis]